MTLVELVMAVLLLTIVLTAGISMELGLRRIYTQTDMEAVLLEEAAPIVSLALKDINRGIGDITNLPYSYTATGSRRDYQIRTDTNGNGMADAGDTWVQYRWYTNTGELRRYPNSAINSYDILSSDKVTNFAISAPGGGNSAVTLQLRYNRSAAASYANPQVNLQTVGQYRSVSTR